MSTKPPTPPGYDYLSLACTRFLQDHPDYERNVFIMTRFATGNALLKKLDDELRKTLCRHGLRAHRADDRMYSTDGQLWNNVCVYMLCCKYGVAVLEDRLQDEFNPNVALEYGFMRGLDKPTLLLKDAGFRNLRADITGTLHQVFDLTDIAGTLSQPVENWIRDIGVGVRSGSAELERSAYKAHRRLLRIQCADLVQDDAARKKERGEELLSFGEELADYQAQLASDPDQRHQVCVDRAYAKVIQARILSEVPKLARRFAELASHNGSAQEDAPVDVKILFRFENEVDGVSDIVVKRTYDSVNMPYNAFSFAVLSDTGVPQDAAIWLENEGKRIDGEIIERFVRDPARPTAYICTARFPVEAGRALNRVLTEYRWRRAGLLSRDAIDAHTRGSSDQVYSKFLYARSQEHVFFKCPTDVELASLEIAVILPPQWAPQDGKDVVAYTQDGRQAEPQQSAALTRSIFLEQDGYYSLRVRGPVAGLRYLLAWTVRETPRT